MHPIAVVEATTKKIHFRRRLLVRWGVVRGGEGIGVMSGAAI
jgi:hypothetical protein